MNDSKKTVFAGGCLVLFTVCSCMGKGVVADKAPELNRAVEAAKQWYAVLAPKLAPTNVPFADRYRQPFNPDGDPPAEIQKDEKGALAYIRAQFMFILEQPSNRVVSVSNPALRKFIEANDTQEVAELTTDRAVEIANGYLQTIGFQCSHPLEMEDAQFNHFLDKHVWTVTWRPVIDGYRFDAISSLLSQYVCVRFHEKYGFIGFGCNDVLPPPRTTEVKVTREFAVTKAERAAPLVMRTPFYLRCRDPNFKVKSLTSAELLIAAPNWLLDPKRAIWIHDKPPDETRLCWVVTFDTVATREASIGLIPPSILIYIDAATGEIVGANFT